MTVHHVGLKQSRTVCKKDDVPFKTKLYRL